MVADFEERHIEKCAEIFFDVYKNEPFNYNWVKKDSVINYFTDIFRTPKFRGFVLYTKNGIEGICAGVISDYFKVKKYRVSEIFVDRRFQRRGAGSKFLSEIQKILYGEGIEIIEITTDRNTPAFNFYLKNNYSVLKNNINMIKITGDF